MKKITDIVGFTFASFVASLVIGGFILGVVHAKDCDWSLVGVLGRLLIGVIFAFLTPLSLGFPPRDEGGAGDPFNAWPYVIPVFVILLPLSLMWSHRKTKQCLTTESSALRSPQGPSPVSRPKEKGKRKRTTVIVRMIVIMLVTVVLCVAVFMAASDYIFSNAVLRSTKLDFLPSANPQPAVVDPQTEAHTCGLHSLRSVYRAYGLNPDEHSLRMRLGVDTPANPVDEASTGTLQPDLTRVLAQDGFAMKTLNLEGVDPAGELESVVSSSNKALALIRKLDNGNLHWIVIQQGPPDHIEIIDPLASEPRHENTEDFIEYQAVTILMLGIQERADKETIKAAHRLGVQEMKKTPGRVKQLERRSP